LPLWKHAGGEAQDEEDIGDDDMETADQDDPSEESTSKDLPTAPTALDFKVDHQIKSLYV